MSGKSYSFKDVNGSVNSLTQTHEPVKFRMFSMPCCGHVLCWVNPRLPNYCPECGKRVFVQLRTKPELTLVTDDNAWLNLTKVVD